MSANAGIFISYRRADTRQAAGRLGDDLAREFGADRIFRDIDRIEIGVDFEQALDQALKGCQLMLVLIGPQWASAADPKGARRLDQPSDWIRAEIATALKRNIRVVPVLVDGASLPLEAELPEDVRPLLRRQAFQLEDSRWRSDVQRLVEGLSRIEGLATARAAPQASTAAPASPPASHPSAPSGVALAAGPLKLLAGLVGLALLGGGAYFVSRGDNGAAAAEGAPAAVSVPDISGTWQTADASETYTFTQDGTKVSIDNYSWQRRGTGRGEGSFDAAGQLSYSVAIAERGNQPSLMQCAMKPSAAAEQLTGNCRWLEQDYPTVLTRRVAPKS